MTLVEKNKLTDDVYELVYECDIDILIIPGQFLLCDTDNTNLKLRRPYSVNDYIGGRVHFIIKELINGKGGSRAICKQELGHTMQVWGPMGAFVLPTLTEEKLIFIGTGTGFAPLYFQTKHILETSPDTSIHFIFGVREERDLFYQTVFQTWSKIYPNFSYQFCLSQGTGEGYFPGRVTDYLRNNSELIGGNTIYSLCGSPSMVGEAREILSARDVRKEQIFFEQY